MCIVWWWHPDGALCVDFVPALVVSVCHSDQVSFLPLLLLCRLIERLRFVFSFFFLFAWSFSLSIIYMMKPSQKCRASRKPESDQRSVFGRFCYRSKESSKQLNKYKPNRAEVLLYKLKLSEADKSTYVYKCKVWNMYVHTGAHCVLGSCIFLWVVYQCRGRHQGSQQW